MELIKLSFIIVTTIYCCTSRNPYYKEVYPAVDLSSDLSNHIFFALIQSFGSEFNGSGNIIGVQLALDRINSNPNILPNHTLHYTLTDSQCMRTIALDALFNQLLSRDGISKVAVLGSGCSVATEPTAEVSHYYNLTHISCSTSSTELLDRSRFRRYFQLLQTMRDIAPIHLALIKHYKWKYVSMVTQNENIFTVAMDSLKRFLDSEGVRFSEKIFESNESIAGLKEPIDPSAHIFIVASYEGHARAFLCEAYRRNIKYPTHLMIFMGWYEGEWWLEETSGTCSPEDRAKVMPYSLSILHFNFEIPEEVTNATSGIRGSEYRSKEMLKVTGPPFYRRSQLSPYCYDATWTLAYALNNALQVVENTSTGIRYDNEAFYQRMLHNVNKSDFIGITGPVNFDAQGIRPTNERQVFQFRKNESDNIQMIKIGDVIEGGPRKFSFLINRDMSSKTLWPDGVPRDGVPKNVTVTIHPATATVLYFLAAIGIVFTLVCLIVNTSFRETRVIKLGSPKLNYLIGIGAIILYAQVYLLALPPGSLGMTIPCNYNPWFFAIGYSLCYGTIVCKMVRIHYIFNYTKLDSKSTISDWKLALGVLILVVIDVVILVTYTTVIEASNGGRESRAQRILNREDPTLSEPGFGIVEYHYFYVCKSLTRDIFVGILYGYKAVLQLVALFLAISIRNVNVKGMNDALYITTAIYITSLLWTVIIISNYSLVEYLNIFTIVIDMSVLMGATAIVGLVFIPMMVLVYKQYYTISAIRTPAQSRSFSSTSRPLASFDITEQLDRRLAEQLDLRLAVTLQEQDTENATTHTII